MVGGRGGGVILRTKRNVLAADRRERRLSFFQTCAYFENTGTRCRLRKKNRKENIKAERLLAEPKAYKDERHNTAPPPSAKEFDNIQKMSNNKSRPRRNVRDYLAKQKTPGKTPKQIQKNIGKLGPASPMRRPLPTSPRSNAFSRGRATTVGAPPHEHHQV